MPDGRLIIVAVVDGVPDLPGASNRGDDVVLPKAVDVPGVELLAGCAPAYNDDGVQKSCHLPRRT